MYIYNQSTKFLNLYCISLYVLNLHSTSTYNYVITNFKLINIQISVDHNFVKFLKYLD